MSELTDAYERAVVRATRLERLLSDRETELHKALGIPEGDACDWETLIDLVRDTYRAAVDGGKL